MKIKEFFEMVWYYISYPFTWRRDKKINQKLCEIAAEDRAALLNERDVEFFKSIGIETDLETLISETLRYACKPKK